MNENLYNALVEWRKNVVRESKGEHLTCLRNDSLKLIASYHPSSMENLSLIRGVGSTTLESFGAEILQVVNSFPGVDMTPSAVDIRMENIDRLISGYQGLGMPNRCIARDLAALCEKCARDEGIEARQILTDKIVVMLSAMHPKTESSLLRIYEIPRLSVYKWGDKIVQIINTWPGEEVLPPMKAEQSLEEVLAKYTSFGLTPDNNLAADLSELREKLSKDHGNRPYPFLTPTQIANIAAMHPLTPESLKKVLKCSDAYVGVFGESVCSCVARYYKEESVPAAVLSYDTRKPSYLESLRLFQEGHSIEQICRERGLAHSTVEEHLVNAYKKGHLSIDRLIDPARCREIASLIQPMIQSDKSIRLAQIYEELGGAYPFDELRLVRLAVEKGQVC